MLILTAIVSISLAAMLMAWIGYVMEDDEQDKDK
tara:strand:+ start:1721 stop:1822 length:102 start_codon:yes stop_codon:yes gene_type:complete